MIINKVIQGGSALLDLTQDTVNENNLLLNETAHNCEGEPIIGTHQSGGAVNSVNGKTGDVVLNSNDVDALPSNTPIPAKTSDLTNDSGYVTASILPIGGTTGQVLAKKSNSDYDMEWVNQSGGGGAVNSVNGKTGTVILDGTDIILTSALPIGGQTKTQVEDSIKALNDVKVDKVAGKGLSAEDYTSASKAKLDGLANIKSIGVGLSLNSSTGELAATGGGSGSVTGVKGNAESTYRSGNVNLTPANIGSLATDGDSKDNTITFTSSDDDATTDKTSDGFTSVATMASGESHASLFQKISKMFLNIRKLWNTVGSTAIDTAYGTTLTAQMANLKSYNTYSTSETWTGEYLINANNIKRKVYSKIIRYTGLLTKNTYTDIGAVSDLLSPGIEEIFCLGGHATYLNEGSTPVKMTYPQIVKGGSATGHISVSARVGANIRFSNDNFVYNFSGFTAIFKYTKTTD